MSEIKFLSTSIIRPASHNTDHRIELTPWDLQFIKHCYPQMGLLYNKSADERVNQSLIHRLKDSLSITLSFFYPLAGRLVATENDEDKTTCFSINCNASGAQFIHAVSDSITMADIITSDCIPDHIIHNFFPMNSVLSYEGTSKPLLAAQVTELVDGIFICFSMNHVVVDGSSFWQLINTWSEISRLGFDKMSKLYLYPLCGTHFRDSLIDVPIRLPFSYSEIIKGRHGIDEQYSENHSLQRVLFHFSKQQVAELKEKANAEMGINNVISSFQALMAHLWRAITRSKKDIDPDEETIYVVVVGLRQRLKPPLPKNYLGNAISDVVVKSTAGDLLEKGLGWAALQINKKIASVTTEAVNKGREAWMNAPEFIPNPRDIPITSRVELLTSNSPRFDVYGNDFGWGKPVAVRSGTATKQNGSLTAFPGAQEGIIDFEACLLPETLHALKNDVEFMRLCSLE